MDQWSKGISAVQLHDQAAGAAITSASAVHRQRQYTQTGTPRAEREKGAGPWWTPLPSG